MSALLEPEQDTVLALQLMGMRKTASDEEFAAVLSQLLGTCRMEGFRISIQALKLILKESVAEGVDKLDKKIIHSPQVKPRIDAKELKFGLAKPMGPPDNTLPPQVRPMRTREEALAAHKAKHPELYNEDGSRKGSEADPGQRRFGHTIPPDIPITDEELERATRPDPPVHRGNPRKVDNEGRADIQRRAKQARLDGQGRYPKGWIRRLAEEYNVSPALIYNVIYADPAYEAVPSP